VVDQIQELILPRLPAQPANWSELQIWWQNVVEQIEAAVGLGNSLVEVNVNAAFLVASASADLSADRVLAVESGQLTAIDGGANSSLTLGLADAGSPGTYGSASQVIAVTIDAKGRVTGVNEFALDSDNVAEGLANLFFTDARARAVISGGAGLIYNSGTGVMDVGAGTGVAVNANDVALDTSSSRNVDHSAVSVIAGAGLTGGGTIALDRTLNIGAGTGITVNADDVALTVPTASGTYTPTLTTVANVAASSIYAAQYLRVGNTVTVSGRVDITPTAGAASTQFRLTIPVASNFGFAYHAGGTFAASNVASVSGAVSSDSGTDEALFTFVSTGTAALTMWYSYTYQII